VGAALADGMMILRDYTPDDQDPVFALNAEAADPGWRIAPDSPTYADLRDIPNTYQLHGAFLVGEVSGEVVAMGGVRDVGDDVFELKRIRVLDAHRRKGYARQLILELERRVRERGARAIILDTTDEQAPALRLYESMDYSFTHTSVREGRDRAFNLVHYRKDLDTG
jgi:ribosomal protein S18 acetylase RimI-like enzyme